MKLITLNIWGGKVYDPLLNFFKQHAEDTDIFCLQEVLHTPADKEVPSEARVKIFGEIQSILENHTGFHAPIFNGWTSLEERVIDEVELGLAMYVKKSITIDSLGDFFVYRKFGDFDGSPLSIPRNVQYVRFTKGASEYTVCNFHGHWNPGSNKVDTPERIDQSKNILEFLSKEKSKVIFSGDFNLAPHTDSLKMLEGNMRNLVKEYGVTSTRSNLYTKEIKFADYIFVSPDVEVKNFSVLEDVVSDHLPLYLEFE